ncbi:MAG: 3-methyl-2-oxobutanoate hydroxymethyltransferase [Anaerotruncus rubiinfantis]|jgi:3-methyl-2-oxobutanoate hydroxymethyltransferase|uniref:3-methyl-2-oxobutanoate hydroxymethyltransferase n=1 Tax=Anaerotruncus TaxID=244127 RepID=UPI00131436A0|nr:MULTISPECIES: 3-methyl-2-oxobutanoate hydroxymethyltransferase [Anaerotruncus]
MAKMTIKQLREMKGKRQMIVVNAPDVNIASACALAGVDNLVIGRRQPVEQTLSILPQIRAAAPDLLITAVMPMDSCLISDETAIRDALKLMEGGADLIYVTGMRPDRIAKLTYQHIPCVAHLGLVPYFSNWIGGFRAIGKTAREAEELYRTALALDDAGAVCAELECIPHQIASYISQRVKFLTYSMGSGAGCDGQYLFASDLLGSHNGHYPRHSIQYDHFFERSVEVFETFIRDVNAGVYPAEKHVIEMPLQEMEAFLQAVDRD